MVQTLGLSDTKCRWVCGKEKTQREERESFMSSSERCGNGSGERERPKPLKGFYTERRDKEEIESCMASKAFCLSFHKDEGLVAKEESEAFERFRERKTRGKERREKQVDSEGKLAKRGISP